MIEVCLQHPRTPCSKPQIPGPYAAKPPGTDLDCLSRLPNRDAAVESERVYIMDCHYTTEHNSMPTLPFFEPSLCSHHCLGSCKDISAGELPDYFVRRRKKTELLRLKIVKLCCHVSAVRPTWHSVPPRRVARWPDCDPFGQASFQRVMLELSS